MKKQILKFLLLSFSLLTIAMNGQTGNSCAQAIEITNVSNLNTITLSPGTSKWLYYSIGGFSIQFKKANNPNLNFSRCIAYSDNCNNLTQSKIDTNLLPDSSFKFRTFGNGRLLKIDCSGGNNESMVLTIIPNGTPSPSCGMDLCEMVDNGRFDYINACIPACRNGTASTCNGIPCCNGFLCSDISGREFAYPNFVPGWTEVDITPQILYNGTNAYAYMWTCFTNISGPPAFTIGERIKNTLCSPVTPGVNYTFNIDYAFVPYPVSNCASSGTQVDKLVAVFSIPNGPSQTVVLASNISNANWTALSPLTINFTHAFTEMDIFPVNDVNQVVSGIKIDNVSLKAQTLNLPSNICLSSSINLSNYNCLSGYTFNCPNAPSTISLVNGAYIFTPTAVGTYTINAVSSGANPIILTSTITVTSTGTCNVSFVGLPTTYCKNNSNAFALATYATPSGGIFSGAGVANGLFYPSATTNPNSTITYNYTCSNGCKKIIFQNINIVNPTIISINTPATICNKAAPINLLNYVSITNGVFTGIGVVNNTFNPSLTAASGGTYTLTYNYTDNNGCAATATKTIQVVLPSGGLSVSASPNKICSGTFTTITATGAPVGSTYTWSNGASGNSIFTNLANVYSVYAVNGLTCLSGSINLFEGDPIPIVLSGNTFGCAGSAITLNATSPNPSTYPITNVFWQPNTLGGTCTAPCTIYTLPMPSVPTVVTAYPVTSNPLCLNYASITISPVPPNQPYCCTAADYVVPKISPTIGTNLSIVAPSLSFTNKVFDIPANTTLIINAANSFTGCTFRCGVNAGIVVNDLEVPVDFTNCFFYACGDFMWNGIVLSNKLKPVSFTGCTIEDALTGVSIGDKNFGVNFTSNVFNKNKTGVHIITNNRFTYSPISFLNNQFTSAASTYSPGNFLKADQGGYIAPRGTFGIYVLDEFPPATAVNIQMQIGSTGASNKNTFSNLEYGIRSAAVYKLKVINNDFINTSYGVVGSNNILIIYNGVQMPIEYAGLEVGGSTAASKNTFINNTVGITYRGGNAAILNNQFTYSTTNPTNGATAIAIQSDYIRNFNISSNTINNYNAGLRWSAPLVMGYDPNFVNSQVNISYNTINGNACNTGIEVLNSALNGTTTIAAPRPFRITNNTIVAKTNAINCLDLDKILTISNNTVTANSLAGATAASTGITINGCDNTVLKANTITSNLTLSPTITNYRNTYGLVIRDSKLLTVQCNTISKLNYGLQIRGNCVSPGLQIAYNTIQSGGYGLVLGPNGEIGTQAYTDAAFPNNFYSCENKWGLPTAFTNAQTATISTINTNTNSKMYLRTAIKPTVNLTLGLTLTNAYNSGGLPTGLAPIICDLCDPNPSNCAASPLATTTVAASTSTTVGTAAKLVTATASIVNNTANYALYNTEQKLRDKKAVYELIAQNPSMKNTATFNAFYNSNKNTCIGKLSDVEDMAAAGNYAQAKIANASFTPSCAADLDLQSYYNLYLKYASDTLADSNIYSGLLAIAEHCPDQVGIVVYKARALYDHISNTINKYTDNCGNNGSGSRVLINDETSANLTNPSDLEANEIYEGIRLSPNPNNGNFILNLNALERIDKIAISIFDVYGKLMLTQNCDSENGICEFNLGHLQKGFYTLRVNDKKSLKLIIQ